MFIAGFNEGDRKEVWVMGTSVNKSNCSTTYESQITRQLLREGEDPTQASVKKRYIIANGKTPALEELRQAISICKKCNPKCGKKRPGRIFGFGNINAELMIIGEFPSPEDTRNQQPFSGWQGQILRQLLRIGGMPPELAYLTTAIKCNPSAFGKNSETNHGSPVAKCGINCCEFLHKQIKTIRPSVILALGPIALETLLGIKGVNISKARGQWYEWNGIPVMTTYSINQVLNSTCEATRKNFADDLVKTLQKLGLTLVRCQRAMIKKQLIELLYSTSGSLKK